MNRFFTFASLVCRLVPLAAPVAADTAVVPTDFPSIQQAVDAVQGTPDALVRIDSSAVFAGTVVAAESVRIEAGEGFRPTLRGATGNCVLVGPCTIELHPTVGGQSFGLRGLRLEPPAGVAPGSGGRHVLLFNESSASATLVAFALELADPAGVSYDGIVSRVAPATPGENSVSVETSRIEVRGLPEHVASAIEMVERGLLSVVDADLSQSGPSGSLLAFFGNQSAFLLSSRFEVDAPATSLHAGLLSLSGSGDLTVADNRIDLRDASVGSVGGIRLGIASGGSGSLLLDSNRFVGDGTGGAYAAEVEPFPGSLGEIVAVNNEVRGLGGGFLLGSQGGTIAATLTHNTVHASVGDAVRFESFGGGEIDAGIFNNLFTRTGGSGIAVELSDGALACELGYNGYFENSGGDIDPSLQALSSNDVFADPRYVDEEDLRLATDSPMIDAAFDSAPEMPKDDIDGVDRPVDGGFDIGAHEGGVAAGIVEIPTLDSAGLTLLACLLAGFAIRHRRQMS